MKRLFIDLEVIAADNGNVFEEAIANIEFKASKKYIQQITQLFLQHSIREEEYRILLEESYDCKDRILEEYDDKYKKAIDYTKVYEINESNESMVDFVNKVSSSIKTCIIFYYNTEREKLEKKSVCKKYFSNCEIIPIKYYQTEYDKGTIRERTNKSVYIAQQFGQEDFKDFMLVDKSKLCCEAWSKLGGYSSLYCGTSETQNNYKTGKPRG